MNSRDPDRKPRVAVARGSSRYEAVRAALDLVHDDIAGKVRPPVLVKPNFLSSTDSLASTQADAVLPVLELLDELGAGTVTVAEGAARSTDHAFRTFGYVKAAERFPSVRLVDLNRDRIGGEFELVTWNRGTHSIQYHALPSEAGTLISVAVAKTHILSTVTLSLKNMVGCLRRIQRSRMHGIDLCAAAECTGEILWNILDKHYMTMQLASKMASMAVVVRQFLEERMHHGDMPCVLAQIRAISENIVRLGGVIMPHIAVIDAFEVMEGEGPGSGTGVRMGLAVAGTDPVACDAVAAYLMGFEPLSIGYLAGAHESGLGCADPGLIETVGENPASCRRRVKPHSLYPLQMRWKEAW